jgi:hypothetical protein
MGNMSALAAVPMAGSLKVTVPSTRDGPQFTPFTEVPVKALGKEVPLTEPVISVPPATYSSLVFSGADTVVT